MELEQVALYPKSMGCYSVSLGPVANYFVCIRDMLAALNDNKAADNRVRSNVQCGTWP